MVFGVGATVGDEDDNEDDDDDDGDDSDNDSDNDDSVTVTDLLPTMVDDTVFGLVSRADLTL